MKPYSIPKMVERDLSKKWYVEFTYINPDTGQPERFQVYNGKKYGIILPGEGNRLKTINDRREWFLTLQVELYSALKNGLDPFAGRHTVLECLREALNIKERELRKRSWEHLELACRRFLQWIDRDKPVKNITNADIYGFLASLEVGNQSRNNYRRDLHTLFSVVVNIGKIKDNPVGGVKKKRVKSSHNVAYTEAELAAILPEAEAYNPNLHLCMLLMLSAFVRPDIEARLMRRESLDFHRDLIIVPPDIHKTEELFIMPMQPDLKKHLIATGKNNYEVNMHLFHDANPFEPYADKYFSKSFQRFKAKMIIKGLIRPEQTLYSVRHTAACMLYGKTRDPEKVRRAMGHKDLKTTLTYLRSLALFNHDIDKMDLPFINL